jgi:hypothetical protein
MRNSIISLILNLSKFEPSKTEDDIKQLKTLLRNVKDYDRILTITEEQGFSLLNSAFQILHNFEKHLVDFNNIDSKYQQNRAIFKSNKAYLNHYISSFKTTYNVFKQIDKKSVIKLEVLQTIISVFEQMQEDQDKALKWLISEYLFYYTIKDKNIKQILLETSIVDETTINIMFPHFTSISDKTLLYVKLFEMYFMGFNLIESDFYKSTYIKLCLFYETYGENIGKNENNVRTVIQNIIYETFPYKINLNKITISHPYVKSIYYDGIAIFSTKKDSFLEGITHRFFEQLTRYLSPAKAQEIVSDKMLDLLSR